MRRPAHFWKDSVAKLGLMRKRRAKVLRNSLTRQLRIESLEDRQMLAVVTTDIDVNDVNDGLTTLREAVALASPGETITFAANLNGATITLDRREMEGYGQISFEKSLTIDARDSNGVPLGITIDGNDPSSTQWDGIRIFNVTDPTNGSSPPNVTMIGLTLTGADTAFNERGGAIQSKGILTLRDMEIVENAGYVGGGVYVDVAGSGSMQRNVLRVENSVFQNNSAIHGGGGIAVEFRSSGQDTVEIIESTLSGNEAGGNGGALYIIGGSGSSSHSVVIASAHLDNNNRATTGTGGAVHSSSDGTNLSFLNTSISGNTSASGGGGLSLSAYGGAQLAIEGCTLSGNTTSGGSGGALAASLSYGSSLRIESSSVSSNSAGTNGGGLSLSGFDGSIDLVDVEISDNTSQLDGGGVHAFLSGPSAMLDIEESTISGNTATFGRGGGVYANSSYGGGLRVQSSAVSSNNSGSISVKHGGGLFAKTSSGSIAIDQSTINGNTSPGYNSMGAGAYLYSNSGSLAITNTTISNNQALGNEANVAGLAVIARDSLNVLIDRVKITGNHADDDLGGLYIQNIGSDVTVTDSTISGNTASHNNPASGTSPFAYNVASGVWLRAENGGQTTIESSTISGNRIITGPDGIKQNVHGAGFFIQAAAGTTTTIRNTTISGNEAEGNGGGIKIFEGPSHQGGVVEIRHSTITRNRANSDDFTAGTGGGIHIGTSTTTVTLDHTIVAENFRGTGTMRDDIVGSVVATWSLIGDSTGATITDNGGNQIGTGALPVNPDLALLAWNGGFTETHRPNSTSTVIDRGNPTAIGLPAFDQRGAGFPRKYDIPGVGSTTGSVVDIGAYEIGLPKVIDVIISGSASTHTPYSFSTVVGNGEQIRTVPVGGANRIEIYFSEPVTLNASDVSVQSARTGSFYSGTVTHSGNVTIWQYSGVILADQLKLKVEDSVSGQAGTLDGNWINPRRLSTLTSDTFPSGNGTAGGDFSFNFTILSGDFNRDHIVDAADWILWAKFNGTMSDVQFWMGDANGDGAVNSADYDIWFSQFGTDFTVWPA